MAGLYEYFQRQSLPTSKEKGLDEVATKEANASVKMSWRNNEIDWRKVKSVSIHISHQPIFFIPIRCSLFETHFDFQNHGIFWQVDISFPSFLLQTAAAASTCRDPDTGLSQAEWKPKPAGQLIWWSENSTVATRSLQGTSLAWRTVCMQHGDILPQEITPQECWLSTWPF